MRTELSAGQLYGAARNFPLSSGRRPQSFTSVYQNAVQNRPPQKASALIPQVTHLAVPILSLCTNRMYKEGCGHLYIIPSLPPHPLDQPRNKKPIRYAWPVSSLNLLSVEFRVVPSTGCLNWAISSAAIRWTGRRKCGPRLSSRQRWRVGRSYPGGHCMSPKRK